MGGGFCEASQKIAEQASVCDIIVLRRRIMRDKREEL